jgi:hypothetical protein
LVRPNFPCGIHSLFRRYNNLTLPCGSVRHIAVSDLPETADYESKNTNSQNHAQITMMCNYISFISGYGISTVFAIAHTRSGMSLGSANPGMIIIAQETLDIW